jgi:hypothetical protein
MCLRLQWKHEFHLYRLYPNETFTYETEKLDSTVRAKALRDVCRWESSLCRPCFDTDKPVQLISTSKIFNEKGWYASFAKISDSAVEGLWNLMKLPFDVSTTQLEHAFISSLAKPMITAGLHANPMTSSMAIQVGYLDLISYHDD